MMAVVLTLIIVLVLGLEEIQLPAAD